MERENARAIAGGTRNGEREKDKEKERKKERQKGVREERMIAGDDKKKKEKKPRMRSCAFYRCGALPAKRMSVRAYGHGHEHAYTYRVRANVRGRPANTTSVMRAITYFRDFA